MIPLMVLALASPGVEVREGVAYSGAQQMDLWIPEEGDGMTAIVWIHGGGWRGGSRGDYRRWAEIFSRDGYFCASIDYRLSGVAPYPAAYDDCVAAVAWIRENASDLRVNPDRIVVGGSSAGGHLALLLGLRETPGVIGVVDLFGPTDLRENFHPAVEQFLQGQDGTEASPIVHVDADDPPVLILHGTDDRTVPIEQSYALRDALQEAGGRVDLRVFEGAGHGLRGVIVEEGEPIIREFLSSLQEP